MSVLLTTMFGTELHSWWPGYVASTNSRKNIFQIYSFVSLFEGSLQVSYDIAKPLKVLRLSIFYFIYLFQLSLVANLKLSIN